MNEDMYNAEGYLDLTAHKAIKAAEAKGRIFRPLVYICSPYSGDVERNVERARKFSRYAVETGYIPVAPHLLFPQFLDDSNKEERELGLFFGNVLMDRCAEVWVLGGVISSGMDAEIKRAKRKNYTIRYFTMEFEEENNNV